MTPVYIQLEPVLGPFKYQIELASEPGSCISYDTRSMLTIERCKTAKVFDVYSNEHGTYDFCKEGSAIIGGNDSKGECVREGNLRRLELTKDVVLRTRAGIAQGAWVLSADGQDDDDAFVNRFGHQQTLIFEIHQASGGSKRWEQKSINKSVVFDQSGLRNTREWRLLAK